MSDYDRWLDENLEDWYSEDEERQEQDWNDYELNEYPDEELD